MEDLTANAVYTFRELEAYLNTRDNRNGHCFLRVKNVLYDEKALFTTFNNNFSKEYQSGDGVLFYEDGETHSANDNDEFVFICVVPIKGFE